MNYAYGHQVYISRLPEDVTEDDIKEFFERAYIPFGIVRNGIRLKGYYGFVTFHDARAADNAVIELNGEELKGKKVKVAHAYGYRRDRGRQRTERTDDDNNDDDDDESGTRKRRGRKRKMTCEPVEQDPSGTTVTGDTGEQQSIGGSNEQHSISVLVPVDTSSPTMLPAKPRDPSAKR